jgi:hypothetical protein
VAQKILIIALVVLVILFVVTLGLGGSHRDEGPTGSDPIGFLRSLQSKRFLVLGQDTNGCAPPGASQFQTPCVITFNDRGRLKKPTKVAFDVVAGTVTVRLRPKQGAEQVTSVPDESNSRCYGSSMDARGGILELSGNATIRLRDSDCPKEG